MDKLMLKAADGAQVEFTTQGAHLCSWIPANGQEQRFISATSGFSEGVAIRGGVPVIFPQFSGLGANRGQNHHRQTVQRRRGLHAAAHVEQVALRRVWLHQLNDVHVD